MPSLGIELASGMSALLEGCVAEVVGAVLLGRGSVAMVLGVVVVLVVLLFSARPQPTRTQAAKAKLAANAINLFMIFLLIFVARLL